jgi:hypothetical protein
MKRIPLPAARRVVASACACACAALPFALHAQEPAQTRPAPRSQVGVDASDSDGFVTLSASADIRADRDTVWRVISDYDHLADFIPDMLSSRIVVRAVGGNLKEMRGEYEIRSLPGDRLRLSYAARLLPAFSVPPLVGPLVMRHELRRQFDGLVDEIVRRDALARKTGPGSNTRTDESGSGDRN